ncbi:MAG: FKBP-type peptidyl-prolyl cis-trans isomerase SlyD [Candidatus Azotimanducaceae bacterium]|jgi:FKBP-type peptidyl-prolyl cis-trans isomerase SlyD
MPKFYKLDYTLLNPAGEEVDSSAGGNPMAFVEGDGTMVPGLEAAVIGREQGDQFDVKIGPEKAYGFSQRSLIRTVTAGMFSTDVDEIEVGMIFQVGSGAEAEVARVVEVEEGAITIDSNHPLAGVSFHFDICVLESREATREELEVRDMIVG